MADMALEEALAAADVSTTPVNDILMVDAEARTIVVPVSEMLFGVRQDMDAERKHFKCPKIVGDNIDLSQCHIYISYVPSKQDGTYDINDDVGGYWCEDLAVDGDYVTFSWKLSGNVFVKAGYIAFAVYAKQEDADGNLQTKWHTTFAIGKVLDTLPDGEQIAEKYADVIEQLLNKMENVEKVATPEAMKGYVEEFLKENPPSGMTDEEREQLNKNTEDISSLSEEIENLNGGMTTNAKALLGTLLRATVYDKDVLADPVTVIDSFLAELDKTVSPEEPDVPVDPEEPTPTTYAVTYNLTSVTSSNNSTTVTEGASYTTVLSSDSAIDTVTVKMGGVDITESVYNSTSKTITIAETTGDIIITASIADSSLLYTLKDASFNGSTIVDTGVALFDESKDFTILFDFKNMYCGNNGTGYLGLVEDDTITDSYEYFVGRTTIANKNADTETIAFNICVKRTPLVTAPSQASDYSSRTYSAKMAITFDSASNKWNGYIRNTATGESAEGTITDVVTTLANTIAIGGTNYRGKASFTCNEFSIYNRVLSVDEISTWIQ